MDANRNFFSYLLVAVPVVLSQRPACWRRTLLKWTNTAMRTYCALPRATVVRTGTYDRNFGALSAKRGFSLTVVVLHRPVLQVLCVVTVTLDPSTKSWTWLLAGVVALFDHHQNVGTFMTQQALGDEVALALSARREVLVQSSVLGALEGDKESLTESSTVYVLVHWYCADRVGALTP
jgi:hypothetical protein